MAARILGQILHDAEDHGSALSRCMKYLSAGEIVEKCKERIRDESRLCPVDPALDLRLLNLMCNPSDLESGVLVACSKREVQKVVMEAALDEMDQPLIVWGRMQHAGYILRWVFTCGFLSLICLLPMSSKILAVDSAQTKMATEYVEKLNVLSILARILADDSEDDYAKGELCSVYTLIELKLFIRFRFLQTGGWRYFGGFRILQSASN